MDSNRNMSSRARQELTCSLCRQIYDNPKTLACLHCFCCGCLDSLATRKTDYRQLRCPVCQETIELPDGDTFEVLPSPVYINRLLELLVIENPEERTTTCGGCHDEKQADTFCFQCESFLCSACSSDHQQHSSRRGHSVLPLRKLEPSDVQKFLRRPGFCKKESHQNSLLEFYCDDCCTTLCKLCVATHQNNNRHSLGRMDEGTEKCRQRMNQWKQRIQAVIPRREQESREAEKKFTTFQDELQVVRLEIQGKLEELMHLIERRGEEFMTQLDEIEEEQKSCRSAQLKSFEQQFKQLNNCVEYANTVLKRNINTEVLSVYGNFSKRCETLVNKPLESEDEKLDNIHVRFQPDESFYQAMEQFVPGRVVVSSIDGQVSEPAVGQQVEFVVSARSSQSSASDLSVAENEEVFLEIKQSESGALQAQIGDINKAQSVQIPVRKFSDTVSPQAKTRQLTRKFSDSALIKRKPGTLTRKFSDSALIKSKPIKEPHYKARRESGSSGDGRGQFEWPLSMAISKKGEVAVTDFDLHRVEIFDTAGEWLREWGREGSEEGQMMNPVGISFDPEGNIVISDSGNQRIQVFDSNGRFIRKMGEGELARPWGVCVTGDGHIAVCDKEDIVVFTSNGELLRRFSQGGPPGWLDDYIVHVNNKFYVSYISTHCVKVFSNEGQFLFAFGEKGEELGQFKFPQGLTVDKNDCLLVADRDDQCVKMFTLDGEFVGQFGKEGDELGEFYSPIDVGVAPDGSVFVVEFGNKRLQLFKE